MPHPSRILAVSREPRLLERIQTFLSGQDFQVQSIDNPADLPAVFQDWTADLVIIDHDLPFAELMELIARLRTVNRSTHFILLTPPGETPLHLQGTRSRIITYLGKPFDTEDLMYCVRGAFCSGESYHNRREHLRHMFPVETSCVLINPFDDSEGRPIPALMRDFSRSGVSLVVRQILPVPCMMKVLVNLPRHKTPATLLAKTISCTLMQMPGIYRLGAKFVGLLPPELQKALGEFSNTQLDRRDVCLGRSFREAIEQWLVTHEKELPSEMFGLPQSIARLAADICLQDAAEDESSA